jgi:hypothetical protein
MHSHIFPHIPINMDLSISGLGLDLPCPCYLDIPSVVWICLPCISQGPSRGTVGLLLPLKRSYSPPPLAGFAYLYFATQFPLFPCLLTCAFLMHFCVRIASTGAILYSALAAFLTFNYFCGNGCVERQ